MKKKHINRTVILLCFILILSCKKEAYENLSAATISSETSGLIMEEGESTIANIILSEELSEDLPLKLSIKIDDIPNFINENDFAAFEYSNDFGKTWIRAVNQTVLFEARNLNLKVRVSTVDDDELEFHEEFDLVFEPQHSIFNLTGTIEPIRISVTDNESVKTDDPIVLQEIEYMIGAFYEVDENNNYNLIALNREGLENAQHKALIDGGLTPDLIKDISNLTQTGGIPINYFEAIFQDSGLGGYVYNFGGNSGEENWVMGMNLLFAYTDIQLPEEGEFGPIKQVPIEYNSNGVFGAILTHEYGHMVTLNQQNEVNGLIPEDECQNLYLQEGCFHSDSVLNEFNSLFYDPDIVLNEPAFVSNYAETNIAEDMAETFTVYVAQDEIAPSNSDSSGALSKLNFCFDHPHLDGLRDKIRQSGVNIKLGGEYEPIYSKVFNYTTDGHNISCQDRVGIVKAFKKRAFIKL